MSFVRALSFIVSKQPYSSFGECVGKEPRYEKGTLGNVRAVIKLKLRVEGASDELVARSLENFTRSKPSQHLRISQFYLQRTTAYL